MKSLKIQQILIVIAVLFGAFTFTGYAESEDDSYTFQSEYTTQLDELCKSQRFESQLWVEDLVTHKVYNYNPDKLYYQASIIKAPYSLWLCEQADNGIIDISGTIQNHYDLCQNSKWIGQYKDDPEINTWKCIDAMILASDNDATAILSRTWTTNYDDEFNTYLHETLDWSAESKGKLRNDATNGYLTARDAQKLLKYLYNYFEQEGTNGPRLKGQYLAAVHNHLWFPDDVGVAKKYGSWENAYHDIGIVYTNHPYLIVCMTDAGEISNYPEDAKKFMQQVGKIAYDMTQNSYDDAELTEYIEYCKDSIINDGISIQSGISNMVKLVSLIE